MNSNDKPQKTRGASRSKKGKGQAAKGKTSINNITGTKAHRKQDQHSSAPKTIVLRFNLNTGEEIKNNG
jgi:translation elongation factor P/translation initiation factor 5A